MFIVILFLLKLIFYFWLSTSGMRNSWHLTADNCHPHHRHDCHNLGHSSRITVDSRWYLAHFASMSWWPVSKECDCRSSRDIGKAESDKFISECVRRRKIKWTIWISMFFNQSKVKHISNCCDQQEKSVRGIWEEYFYVKFEKDGKLVSDQRLSARFLRL